MRASRSCASASYGCRSSPRNATRSATSICPRVRRASPRGKKTILAGLRASSSLQRRISSDTDIALDKSIEPRRRIDGFADFGRFGLLRGGLQVLPPDLHGAAEVALTERREPELQLNMRVLWVGLGRPTQLVGRLRMAFELSQSSRRHETSRRRARIGGDRRARRIERLVVQPI